MYNNLHCLLVDNADIIKCSSVLSYVQQREKKYGSISTTTTTKSISFTATTTKSLSAQPPQNFYPQYAQQPLPTAQQPKPKRRGCLISSIVAAIVVVAIIAVAAASGGHASTSNTSASSNTTSSAKTFKVGDVVTVGTDWQVTVNTVKTSTGDNFDQPKSENIFLEASVTLKNISSQAQTVSSLVSWTLKDAAGQAYTESIVINAPKPPDGSVAAGDKLTGTLSYEVPQSQKQFELAFSPDIVSSDQTIWNVSV